MIDDLEAYLADIGANARVERYPGVHHGFAFPQRGSLYDKAAAERHWERLHALFARNLAGRPPPVGEVHPPAAEGHPPSPGAARRRYSG